MSAVDGPAGDVDTAERAERALAAADRADQRRVRFARVLLGRAGASLGALDDRALAALASAAYAFYAAPGSLPRVRAYVPSPEREGWSRPGAVLETVVGDRAFVVDTVRETLVANGVEPEALLHPILGAARAPNGALTAVGPPTAEVAHESFLHVWLPPLDPAALARVAAEVGERLADLVLVTDDHAAMLARLRATAAALEEAPDDEAHAAAALLDWLAEGAFVLLGWREYALGGEGTAAALQVRPGRGLGLLRADDRSRYAAPRPLADLPDAVRARLRRATLVAVDKARTLSPVHRRAHMDDVTVLERDRGGRIVGIRRLLGLFSTKAHADEASTIPPLRRVLVDILRAEGAVPDGHDWKTISTVFDTLPKSELLGSTVEEVRADVRTIVAAELGDDVVASVSPRRDGRCVRVLVVMPAAKVSGEAAARVADVVAARLGGTIVDEHLHVADEAHGRLFVRLVLDAPASPETLAALEPAVAAVFGTWEDALRGALHAHHGAEEGERLAARWAAAFPPGYRATVAPADAASDVARLARLGGPGALAVAFEPARPDGETVLRVYRAGAPLVLADVLPPLEHLGLRVLGEDRVVVTPAGASPCALHRFQVQDRRGRTVHGGDTATRLAEAVLAVWAGRATDDVLNRLVLESALDWRAVEALRAYAGWATQAGLGTRAEVWAALADHPEAAAALYACFRARFQPGEVTGDPRGAFLASLERVPSLRADRLLRDLLAAVDATVRTNVFARDPATDVVALKLTPRALSALAGAQPLFEIYVRSPAVEGAHLRAGRIARGGIRASDRPEDFRTEVLGLMRTQTVKNALIVPTGAKGAFVARGGASTLDAYRAFVAALLDLTDDLVQGRPVPPRGLVVHDEPDPYLVVAADKGTATFSDTANAIAASRGFWLGDAFASGGSYGYDHKALAVTARGAWECVRTHARTLGRDADTAPLTVVGIGDMSGDVFGNGLLRSPHVRLLAAFDHRHVFLDPAPDPARSFAERQRLFAERRGWDAYDRALLSAGAMVVPRTAKRVTLTPEVQAMLGLAEPEASGEALVRAVLTMDADLLWNGGIGTYVRAAGETDAAVGDPANDTVRVTADALRVRIVAEGGNLGLTQRARVEFALRGGQVNTDAIDNSAGVDTSDHEVNLKIGLQPLLAAGQLAPQARNRLLADVQDDVVARVLGHNRSQSRLLTVDQARSRTRLEEFLDHALDLERAVSMDRGFERLPDRETLRARRQRYLGLTRPELAVLVAYTKIRQQQELLASTLPDDPLLEPFLLAYFPAAIVARAPDAVRAHPLRREIIATQVVSTLIDACGATFVHRLRRDTGATVAEAVRAWAIAWRLLDGSVLDAGIADASLPLDDEIAARLALEAATARASRWVLGHAEASEPAAAVAARLAAAVAPLRPRLAEWLGPGERAEHEARLAAFGRAGLPVSVGTPLAGAEWLAALLDVGLAAREHGLDPAEAAARYWALGDVIDFAWLSARLAEVKPEDRWQRRAQDGLAEELLDVRRRLVARPAAELPARPLDVVRALLSDLRTAPRISLAALTVVVRELRRLADVFPPLARPERTQSW